MSVSPPIRRYSSTSSSSREDLINQYEAEEERIVNLLSRKLERLREEKITLENTLEAESESHVNRLSREISALRLAQQQAQVNGNGSGSGSPVDSRVGLHSLYKSFLDPSPEMMLEAMRRENEQLRARLVDTERDYVRISRLNEIYREELIEHRRRLGLSVDNLIGLSPADPYSQPTHRRTGSTTSGSASVLAVPSPQRSQPARSTTAVPIPRPPSQIHRPAATGISDSESNTPLSSSSSSPYPFSPSSVSPLPASVTTAATSPPSSAPLAFLPVPGTANSTLSYPSVPPPSLSSSFGSPEAMHRRGSLDRRVAETGSLRSPSRGSRHGSVERGARLAETGILLPRGRVGRESLREEIEDAVETTHADTINGLTNSHRS
ncbi:hypothetical protein WOLCODRAFT_124067 [Wolfiporia cocos MD-104 SS10]|uniref:Uncharacterized protein n=1 Tax=Wolfiporia cocos (strain MD-104) TaxID=742152 RepID=A0A2H3K3N6_WOLCO|nr:hypothetical protein WOLCODRAFT_124067 [Wolfiporia cocos MD-104 SS10]